MYFMEEVWTRQDDSGRLGRGAGTFSQRRHTAELLMASFQGSSEIVTFKSKMGTLRGHAPRSTVKSRVLHCITPHLLVVATEIRVFGL